MAMEEQPNSNVFRALIFNLTRDRKARPLLQMLAKSTDLHFDFAVFTPNVIRNTCYHADSDNKTMRSNLDL